MSAVPANAFCRDILHAVGEGVLAFEESHPHHIRFVNPAAEAILGQSEASIIGHALADAIQLVAAGDGTGGGLLGRLAETGPFEALTGTPWRGTSFPVAFVSAHTIDGAGLAVLTFREIGNEWEARENLRLAEEVFEYSPEAILVTDSTGTILRVNPAFTLITGYRPEEAIGHNLRILRSDRHDAEFYRGLWQCLHDKGHWHGEIWDRRRNGETYPKWLEINAVKLPSGDVRYVALFADISERKAHEQRIDYLARHDSLTGLANRRQLAERAGHLFASGRRSDAGAVFLLIDLDRFKQVNDSLGIALHPEDGADMDALLKAADIAMYQVKADGRNGWRFFEQHMDTGVAFLDGAARSADAVAFGDVEVYVLSRKVFDQFAEEHKKVALGVMEGIASVLASRLRYTNAELRALEA